MIVLQDSSILYIVNTEVLMCEQHDTILAALLNLTVTYLRMTR